VRLDVDVRLLSGGDLPDDKSEAVDVHREGVVLVLLEDLRSHWFVWLAVSKHLKGGVIRTNAGYVLYCGVPLPWVIIASLLLSFSFATPKSANLTTTSASGSTDMTCTRWSCVLAMRGMQPVNRWRRGVTSRFSGFKSLWITFLEWRYSMALAASRRQRMRRENGKGDILAWMRSWTVPYGASSMIK
jgi:hypothetical protein